MTPEERFTELVTTATNVLGDLQDPPSMCSHVALDNLPKKLCLLHPKVGVRCAECMRDHVDRHPWACGLCGAEDVDLEPGTLPADVTGGSLQHPNEMAAVYVGRVEMTVMVCRDCASRIAVNA